MQHKPLLSQVAGVANVHCKRYRTTTKTIFFKGCTRGKHVDQAAACIFWIEACDWVVCICLKLRTLKGDQCSRIRSLRRKHTKVKEKKNCADLNHCGNLCYAKHFAGTWLSSIVLGSVKRYWEDQHVPVSLVVLCVASKHMWRQKPCCMWSRDGSGMISMPAVQCEPTTWRLLGST